MVQAMMESLERMGTQKTLIQKSEIVARKAAANPVAALTVHGLSFTPATALRLPPKGEPRGWFEGSRAAEVRGWADYFGWSGVTGGSSLFFLYNLFMALFSLR